MVVHESPPPPHHGRARRPAAPRQPALVRVARTSRGVRCTRGRGTPALCGRGGWHVNMHVSYKQQQKMLYMQTDKYLQRNRNIRLK